MDGYWTIIGRLFDCYWTVILTVVWTVVWNITFWLVDGYARALMQGLMVLGDWTGFDGYARALMQGLMVLGDLSDI